LSDGDRPLAAYQLAAGYPTLMPQELKLPVFTLVMLPKSNRLLGSYANRLWFVPLTEEGWYSDQVTMLELPNFNGRAVCYSEKFDRLYLVVEHLP